MVGTVVALSILSPADTVYTHTPGCGVSHHGRLALVGPAAHYANGFNTVLLPQRRQRMQVIGPGTTERDQAFDTAAPGLRNVRAQLEGFIARRQAASAIEAQQADSTERDAQHGLVGQMLQ